MRHLSDRSLGITSLCLQSGSVAYEGGTHGSYTPLPNYGAVSGFRNGVRMTPSDGADVGEA